MISVAKARFGISFLNFDKIISTFSIVYPRFISYDMKRGYTIEKVEIILSKFKKEIPNLAFATDIITGYPTETEEDHQKTVELIKKYKPDILNLSKFSKHKGTSADKLKDLQKKILNQRNQEIMRVHRKTALENKNK